MTEPGFAPGSLFCDAMGSSVNRNLPHMLASFSALQTNAQEKTLL
jgi:hypothetical protein